MERTMPPGAEPLALFRTIGRSERAWSKFAAASLLDRGPLTLREREVVIDRTAARTGCDYEWGVHVRLFGERAELSDRQIKATAERDVDPELWSPSERVLLQTVDTLLDKKRLSDPEYDRLAAHFDEAQILEIVQLIAFYHGVALICGTFDLAPEPGMPNLPSGE
jgi:alkylhydroperoxidase family enzyme